MSGEKLILPQSSFILSVVLQRMKPDRRAVRVSSQFSSSRCCVDISEYDSMVSLGGGNAILTHKKER